MYKFRFKNLGDMHDNIKSPLDVLTGPTTIETHLTTADNRHFTLFAIITRPEGGSWQLLKNPNNTPQTAGDVNVINGQNAMVILLYLEDGIGGGGHGIGVYTFALPQDLSFTVSGIDDDVTIESINLPVVINAVTPPAAWAGGNYVDSYNAAVSGSATKSIALKADAQMGGTLTSVISLVDGHNVAPATHAIPFTFQENNVYLVCYDIPAKETPTIGKQVDEAIYVWVSAGPKVDADGWGIVGGHIIHVPGNNPLSQELQGLNKEIMTQYKSLQSGFTRLVEFSNKHVKELSQLKSRATIAQQALHAQVLERETLAAHETIIKK